MTLISTSTKKNSTAPGDILPTADGHGSSLTAAVWCRFPMPHAAGHTQTIGTTRRISWRATSTRRATTTLAQGHRESPVLTLISTSTKKKNHIFPQPTLPLLGTYFTPRMGTTPPRPPQFGAGSPMPHAAGHVQTIGTTRKISWRAISTRRSATTLAQGPR